MPTTTTLQQQPHHFELRHATTPTYLVSYLFPTLLLIYEIYRVASWMSTHGMSFVTFDSMGYEFLLMLAWFGLQIITEIVFLVFAVFSRNQDFGHRIANVVCGIFCSAVVLVFDFGLQHWV
jgi:hypothetical protein